MLWKLLMATLPLVAGGLIYVAFRTETLLMFQWFAAIGLEGPVSLLRAVAEAYCPRRADVLLFSAPNGLWLLSYCVLLSLIWRDPPKNGALPWLLVLYVFAIGSEILQLAGVLDGRFDGLDIAAYSSAALFGVLLLTSGRRRNA